MGATLDIPKYDPANGIRYKWENGSEITVNIQEGRVVMSANKEGLLSMANHLLNLGQQEIPSGHHLHFDEHNSLEEGSAELIIQKR